MLYAYTTGVILYSKPDQPFFIHRAYHCWFNEYIYCHSIQDNHNPGYLILQQDHASHIHNSDLLRLIL